MTDIDFDALDKAVNSLMSDANVAKNNDTSPEGVLQRPVPVAAANPTPAGSSGPSVASEPPTPVSQSNATPQPQSTPLAVKRRGQFMDIVPPAKSAPMPVSRQGVTLEAPKSTLEAPRPSTSPEVVAPTQAPVSMSDPIESTLTQLDKETTEPLNTSLPATEPAEITEEPSTTSPASSTPELSSQGTSLIMSNATSYSQEDEEVPSEVVAEVAKNSTEEPLSSPFLADAKVEKRPLGSPVSAADDAEVAATEPSSNDPVETPNDAIDYSTDQPQIKPTVLPEELQQDVASLEAAPVTTPVVDHEDEIPQPSTPEPVAAGGSIAQQYAEQPSTGDQTSGAIFDTATYHAATDVAVPAKKSSKVVWIIVWILALLCVGAAAGAGYFFFTTH